MDIYNIEELKDQFIQNTIDEYTQRYAPQMMELAVYYLNDFVNNLTANNLALIIIPQQPEPAPVQPQPQQVPFQRQSAPPRSAMSPYQPEAYQYQNKNPFNEEIMSEQQQIIEEYRDPRTQKMRVNDVKVKMDVAEMNEQLKNSQPRRVLSQVLPPLEDINLVSEKSKTFVDKIKEMRTPRKKEGINPDE